MCLGKILIQSVFVCSNLSLSDLTATTPTSQPLSPLLPHWYEDTRPLTNKATSVSLASEQEPVEVVNE